MREYTFVANGSETIKVNAYALRNARKILEHLGLPRDAKFLVSCPL